MTFLTQKSTPFFTRSLILLALTYLFQSLGVYCIKFTPEELYYVQIAVQGIGNMELINITPEPGFSYCDADMRLLIPKISFDKLYDYLNNVCDNNDNPTKSQTENLSRFISQVACMFVAESQKQYNEHPQAWNYFEAEEKKQFILLEVTVMDPIQTTTYFMSETPILRTLFLHRKEERRKKEERARKEQEREEAADKKKNSGAGSSKGASAF